MRCSSDPTPTASASSRSITARFDPPLMLDFSEEEFEATVRSAGPGARSLWPEVPEAEAGVRLLLVHLYESLCGMKTPVRRVYLSEGQVWAE